MPLEARQPRSSMRTPPRHRRVRRHGTPAPGSLADGRRAPRKITAGQRRADALGLLAEAALAADLDRGAAGDRYQSVIWTAPRKVRC